MAGAGFPGAVLLRAAEECTGPESPPERLSLKVAFGAPNLAVSVPEFPAKEDVEREEMAHWGGREEASADAA